MSTSPCVPFLPSHGLPIRWSTWVLGAQPWAPYRRRGRQRTGHSLCPRGVSTLRGSSNSTSEMIRKLNRGEPSIQLSGSALRNTSGPSEAEGSLRQQIRVGRAGLAEKKGQEVGGRRQPDQAEPPSPGQDGGLKKGGAAPLRGRQSTPSPIQAVLTWLSGCGPAPGQEYQEFAEGHRSPRLLGFMPVGQTPLGQLTD